MAEKEKHYFRSDGNGGLNVSHSVAIISIVIMLFLAMIPAAVAWGVLQTKVDANNDISSTNGETLIGLEDTAIDNKVNIAVITERVENIEDDVSEIKTDVKLLLTR